MKPNRTVATIVLLNLGLWGLSGESLVHVVKKQENLYRIAGQYGITVDQLEAANEEVDPNALPIGYRLIIPDTYIVEKGDNLFRLALAYDTTVEELKRLNNLEDDALKVGERILIPRLGDSGSDAQSDVSANDNSGTGIENSVESAQNEVVQVKAGGGNESRIPFWPVEGDRRRRTGTLKGMEILGNSGDTVYSVSSGRVVWSSAHRGWGNVVMIESVNNYTYFYGLYSSAGDIELRKGDEVSQGTKIGNLGVDPNTGEAKLFFTIYKKDTYIDPELAPRN